MTSLRVSKLPRSGIREILDSVKGDDVINLAAGDPNFPTPEHITVAACNALTEGATHYTHGRGLIELREQWSNKLEAENSIRGIDPRTQVVVTAGALNALAATFLAILNEGDRVLLPDPGFANYEAQVLLAGGVPVATPYPFDSRFAPDLGQLEEAASKAKVLIVNSPANPTGAVLSEAELHAIADIAKAHDLLVIADEAYEHLVYAPVRHLSIASLPGMSERTLSIHSMSKSWAMTGWRVGYVSGPAEILDLISKVQEHVIGCPPAATQWGALTALTGPITARRAMFQEYEQRRRLTIDALSGIKKMELVEPYGAFYAFPRINVGLEGKDLALAIASETGVISVPGTAFGLSGDEHVRLCYAGDRSSLTEGLRRLRAWARLE